MTVERTRRRPAAVTTLRAAAGRWRGPGFDLVDLLAPDTIFPLLWGLGVAVAQLKLFNYQGGGYSLRAWLTMVIVPLAFLAGAQLTRPAARAVAVFIGPRTGSEPDRRHLRRVTVAFSAVGALEMVHQLAVAGTLPLLSGHIDTARFTLPGGPASTLLNCLPLGAAMAVAVPQRLSLRTGWPELSLAAADLVMAGLVGGRGLLVLGIFAALLARSIYRSPPSLFAVGIAGGVAAVFIVAVFYVRTRQVSTQPFELELYRSVLPSVPAPLRFLIPLHIGLESNFDALARIVDWFPAHMPFGHGAYDASGFHSVIPGSKVITDVSAHLTGPFVTVTAAGTLWADGGFAWVVLGMAATGAACASAYRVGRGTRRLGFVLIAAYLAYFAVFGVYTNLFTQHPDWTVMLPVTWIFGSLAERDGLPYRLLCRLTGRTIDYRRTDAVRLRPMIGAAQRTRVLIAAATIAALVLVGIVLGNAPPAVRSAAGSAHPAGPLFEVRALGPAGPTGAALVSNGDTPLDNQPLLRVEPGRGTVTLRPVLTPQGAATPPALRVPTVLVRGARLAVASWTGEAEAVFLLRPTEAGVAVAVYGPRARRVLVRTAVNLPLPLPSEHRDVFVASRGGTLPDLFVLDRGVAGERPRLTVYSGVSNFRQRSMSVRLPLSSPLTPARWLAVVGRVYGQPGDLILFTPRGASGSPEVHILAAGAGYSRFAVQAPIPRLASRPTAAGMQIAITTRFGRTALDVVAPSGQVGAIRLSVGPSPG